MRNVLQTGCLILGILCLFYFAAIILYTGLSEWFMFVWAAGGVLFLILWRLFLYQSVHPQTAVRYVSGTLTGIIVIGLLLILPVGSKVAGGMSAKPKNGLDYVIVLGARVRGDQPTRALRKRLDKAMEYAQKNPDTVFILSGGQGPDEGISEAQCMYNYMEEKGMNTDRLLLEDRSTSTLENMRYSARYLDKELDQIGIVSNNFHIFRAMLLAEGEGYQNICGIPASSDLWMQPHYILREICALLVMKLKRMW